MGDDTSVAMKGSDTRQRRKVIHFVPHPEFEKGTFKNDVAVIRVCECEKIQMKKKNNFCFDFNWNFHYLCDRNSHFAIKFIASINQN